MVKKGEFIDFAANLKVESDILKKEYSYSTEMQIIIELSKKIIILEERIAKLEKEVKR